MGKKETLKLLTRDFLTGVVLLSLVILACFAYTQMWPPFLVVESGSMMHGDDTNLGVIDTGDMVLLKKASSFMTYVEGRAANYSTYGDYGDVIVFQNPQAPYYATPIIHRPIMYVRPNGTSGYDVPALNLTNVTQVKLNNIGWKHDLNITFWLGILERKAGYITMGDHNPYAGGNYDPWIVLAEYVMGVARGEIPGGGVAKLILSTGTEDLPSGAILSFVVLSATVFGIAIGIDVWLWRWNIIYFFRRHL